MNRIDVYTAVHKMQRARLFALIVEAGKTDPDDSKARAAATAAVDAVVLELHQHADHEDRFIHPLLRQAAPAIAAKLDADHLELDRRLDALRAIAASFAEAPVDGPNALYRTLASFTAAYLNHVAVEETEALPALWGNCSDDEMLGIMRSFKGSRSDTQNLTSLLAQLATLNPPELTAMASAGLGDASIAEVSDVLATLLNPVQLAALHRSFN